MKIKSFVIAISAIDHKNFRLTFYISQVVVVVVIKMRILKIIRLEVIIIIIKLINKIYYAINLKVKDCFKNRILFRNYFQQETKTFLKILNKNIIIF